MRIDPKYSGHFGTVSPNRKIRVDPRSTQGVSWIGIGEGFIYEFQVDNDGQWSTERVVVPEGFGRTSAPVAEADYNGDGLSDYVITSNFEVELIRSVGEHQRFTSVAYPTGFMIHIPHRG